MKYNDVSMKNQYNERMASRINTESLLSSAMVAYHLKKTYKGGEQVEILANFSYCEDNIYFAEKYLKNEYYDEEEDPVDYWGTAYTQQDRRDEEYSFLKRLFNKKIIKDLVVSWGEEEDPIGLGIKTKRPKKYKFIITDGYFTILDTYMTLADHRIRTEEKLNTTNTPTPVVQASDTKAVTPDTSSHQKERNKTLITVHALEPEHYNKRAGVLHLSPTDKVTIAKRGSSRKKNGLKYDQCYLLECVFKDVNTLKKGVKISKILGVSMQKIKDSDEKKVRNLLQEINEKVAEVGGPKNLVKMQSQKVFINNSYLS